jgi:hypothetical protein
MIPTPAQPHRRYGIGAVNYHTGETVVQFRRRKRRQEIAQLLEALLATHPTGTIYVAWDNASTHEDDEVEAVVRSAAGRLVLLYLPTYSPWLNPIEEHPTDSTWSAPQAHQGASHVSSPPFDRPNGGGDTTLPQGGPILLGYRPA